MDNFDNCLDYAVETLVCSLHFVRKRSIHSEHTMDKQHIVHRRTFVFVSLKEKNNVLFILVFCFIFLKMLLATACFPFHGLTFSVHLQFGCIFVIGESNIGLF